MFFSNWYKEPDEEKINRRTEFFHKLDNNGWKMHTGARGRKQKYIYMYLYISLYENLFENGWYIYIYNLHGNPLARRGGLDPACFSTTLTEPPLRFRTGN